MKAPPPSSSASPLCKGKDDDGGSDDDEDVHGDEDEDDDAFEDDMSESEDDDDDHEVDEESDDGGEKLSKKQKKAPPAKCGKCGFVNANCACAAPLRYEYLEAEIDKTGPIGMTLGMKAGSAAVVDIKQNSAAAGTGIRIGDQVEGLNGTMVIEEMIRVGQYLECMHSVSLLHAAAGGLQTRRPQDGRAQKANK